MEILLVEDQEVWFKKIKDSLEPFGIEIVYYRTGEQLINAVRQDEADLYKIVLIDLRLPKLSGREVARQLRELKPYLKLFAVTLEDDLDEVARIRLDHPFDGFLPKRNLSVESKLAGYVQQITEAANEVQELLMGLPFANKPEHLAAYQRVRNPSEWPAINKEIQETAERLLDDSTFTRNRTLRDSLPTRSHGKLLVENILVARRVILAEILNRNGKLHLVEKVAGYEEESDQVYSDVYKMYDSGFKNYCSELGLRPDVFRNSGEGVLPEEERWLKQWCKDQEVTYAFPLV